MRKCASMCAGARVTCERRHVRACVCKHSVCVSLSGLHRLCLHLTPFPGSEDGTAWPWPYQSGHGTTTPAVCVPMFATCWSKGLLHSMRRPSLEDNQKVALMWTARSLGISKPGLTSSGFPSESGWGCRPLASDANPGSNQVDLLGNSCSGVKTWASGPRPRAHPVSPGVPTPWADPQRPGPGVCEGQDSGGSCSAALQGGPRAPTCSTQTTVPSVHPALYPQRGRLLRWTVAPTGALRNQDCGTDTSTSSSKY